MTEMYEFIDAEYASCGNAPTITRMCAWLEVSKSGFYDWKSRPESGTAKRQKQLGLIIARIFADSDSTYGYRRITEQLARQGTVAGPELVRKIMRQLGLVPCQPRPWRPSTTQQGQAGPIPDLVNRDFSAEVPGQKMAGDITYSAQPVVMCSRAVGTARDVRTDGDCAVHNQRASRKVSSSSWGRNGEAEGAGSGSLPSAACLAARSASRYWWVVAGLS